MRKNDIPPLNDEKPQKVTVKFTINTVLYKRICQAKSSKGMTEKDIWLHSLEKFLSEHRL